MLITHFQLLVPVFLLSISMTLASALFTPFNNSPKDSQPLPQPSTNVTSNIGNLPFEAASFIESSDVNGNVNSNNVELTATQPMPEWLKKLTGLNIWPGLNPPYVPLDFIDFNKIPKIPLRTQGVCPIIRNQCSFDCFKCVSHDDVYTCPKLSQTFDDGPSRHTHNLLKHLKNKSTFFTLGLNVVKYPEIYREIVQKGHLTGSHTWSHKFLPSLTNEEIISQFQWSIWAMNVTGHHLPKWYRPPYGGIDDRVRSIARMFGMQAVVWDHDSFDWQMESIPQQRTKKQILNDVMRWKEQGRGLILEHDVYKSTTDLGIEINKILGSDQMTVAQCVDGIDYVKVFPH